jgi:hypothetical protein
MKDIWDALEATANRKKTGSFDSQIASRRDVLNHRDYLMRFLEEIDGEKSVAEVREALENWVPND